ncbi:MAG TPA: RNA methyltransferase [Bacteroidota bacterium]|nr:RNA methyltransferase [Bacteroidota bacterium]
MDDSHHISKQKLKFAKSLLQKKHRTEEALFIIEGWRSLVDACAAGVHGKMFLYTHEAQSNAQYARVFASVLKIADEAFEVSEHELSTVSDTVAAQGVVMILPQFTYTLDAALGAPATDDKRIIVALDRISEPGNAGSIIRSADWFGASAVVMSEESVEMYNPKVVRSTMGSIFHLPVIECGGKNQSALSFADALIACKKAGFTLYAADVNASADLRSVHWDKNSLIVIGNEAHGLSHDVVPLVDRCVTIPKFGKAESLNAGTAAAVILGAMRL